MPTSRYHRRNTLKALALFVLLACAGTHGQSPLQQPIDPALATLGAGFVSSTAQVNGTTLHYIRGGTGPAIILLHGFPQDWYEFHRVIPRLTTQFTVVAVDLRGVGGSSGKPGGYDAANMAQDVHELAEHLHLKQVYLAGHDIGGMVAYAFARLYPETSRGVMILDVPLPGLGSWAGIKADPMQWHISFHQTPELPEQLVAGRQAIYFRYFLDRRSVSDVEVAHYAESYAAPEHLHAAFEFYRAFPANEQFNAAQQSPIRLPLVVAAGEHSPFGKSLLSLAEALRAHGCASVQIEVIKGSAHYVADEQPEALAGLIERYASL
jgi:pimeloyl-ACP methyl ester carboxylesterase